jgi:hypothetical protein
MRIPFIVWGMGGEWPELVGPADVRGLLRRNLFIERGEAPPRARFVPTPERSMLQYAPSLTEPARIGLRTVDGVSVYDFMSGDYRPARPEAQPVPSGAPNANDPSTFQELVWRWEKAQADRDRLGHLR